MNHFRLKSALGKFSGVYASEGEEGLRVKLAEADYTTEEQEEIVAAIKNPGGPIGGDNTGNENMDPLEELEKLRKLNAELEQRNQQLEQVVDQKNRGGNKSQTFNGKRNDQPAIKGQSTYDMYKVEKEIVQDPNDPNKQIWNGQFIQVGKPIKSNIRVTPARAKILNDQSHNSGQRLYEVK